MPDLGAQGYVLACIRLLAINVRERQVETVAAYGGEGIKHSGSLIDERMRSRHKQQPVRYVTSLVSYTDILGFTEIVKTHSAAQIGLILGAFREHTWNEDMSGLFFPALYPDDVPAQLHLNV